MGEKINILFKTLDILWFIVQDVWHVWLLTSYTSALRPITRSVWRRFRDLFTSRTSRFNFYYFIKKNSCLEDMRKWKITLDKPRLCLGVDKVWTIDHRSYRTRTSSSGVINSHGAGTHPTNRTRLAG